MSDVWEYFQKIQNEDNTIILSINCQLCEAEYGISTSTTTLRRHLTGTHSSVYNQQQKQPLPYTLAEQKHITVNLAQWISVDLQPFSVVKRIEFQQFIHTLDSCYTIPCRQTIKQEIDSLFSQRRTNIQLEMNSFTTKVALTTDIWTSSHNYTSYL